MTPVTVKGRLFQQDGSSNNARVAGEAALPDAVGENRGAWPAGQVLDAAENPAQRRRCAKYVEELLGNMQSLELNRQISAAEGLVERPMVVQRGTREHFVVARRHLLGDGDRAVVAAVWIGFVQLHHPLRLPKRQRLKDHSVDYRENSGIGSDPSASAVMATAVNSGLRRMERTA
jgi:hypothetical protein